VVGHSLHERQFVVGEVSARCGAERQRAEHFALHHERMAGVGLDAVGLDQLRARVRGCRDVLRDDPAGVAGGAATYRDAVVEPLDALRLFLRDAGAGVEVQAAGIFVYQEV
jgi:hypothetical protein